MKALRSSRGQLVLPMLAVLVLFGLFLIGYIQLCRHIYWRMRMDMAADAAALSAARAAAAMLNNISSTNVSVNLFINKAQLGGNNYAEMPAYDVAPFIAWKLLLKSQVWGFRTHPAGVGRAILKLNGAEPNAPYFPFPMNPYLLPQRVHVMIVNPLPVPPEFVTYDDAYYARAWKPGVVPAQPVHKTTWMASHQGIRSIATAEIWLDADPGSMLNNGGFPRERESTLRGIGIQGWPAQFNARLLPAPALSIE